MYAMITGLYPEAGIFGGWLRCSAVSMSGQTTQPDVRLVLCTDRLTLRAVRHRLCYSYEIGAAFSVTASCALYNA